MAGEDATTYCTLHLFGVCFHLQYLAEKPDINRFICSNQAGSVLFLISLLLLLGQCRGEQRCYVPYLIQCEAYQDNNATIPLYHHTIHIPTPFPQYSITLLIILLFLCHIFSAAFFYTVLTLPTTIILPNSIPTVQLQNYIFFSSYPFVPYFFFIYFFRLLSFVFVFSTLFFDLFGILINNC